MCKLCKKVPPTFTTQLARFGQANPVRQKILPADEKGEAIGEDPSLKGSRRCHRNEGFRYRTEARDRVPRKESAWWEEMINP